MASDTIVSFDLKGVEIMGRGYWREQVQRIIPLLSERYLRCVYWFAVKFVEVADDE